MRRQGLWSVGLAGMLAWAVLGTSADAQLPPRSGNTPTPLRSPTPLPTIYVPPTPRLGPVRAEPAPPWPTLTHTPTAELTPTLSASPAVEPTPPPSPSPASEPTPGAAAPGRTIDLAALLLTPADVPSGLVLEPRLSGPISLPGMEGQAAAFVATATLSGPVAAATLAPGTLVMVMNAAYVFGDRQLNPQGLEGMVRGAPFGGDTVPVEALSPIPLPDPPVGVESRALALRRTLPNRMTMSTAVVLFQREAIYVSVVVGAIGEAPPIEEAVRLARLVDERVLAAGPR
jgi:hypothetical protein